MKVLLISYHFPPDPAVGSARTGRVARALRAAGHEVHALGPILEGHPPETGDATVVHRVRRRRNPREIALAVKQALSRGSKNGSGGASSDGGYRPPTSVPRWKRFLLAMALFPDDQQGFILPAVHRARRLHREHRFDLIYTSGPPHSAQVAGLLLKKLLGVRWAAEFRDPWMDNAMQPRLAQSETVVALKRWLERRTLALADHIIAVSERAGRTFEAKAGARSGRVLVVRNGIDVASPAQPAPHGSREGTFRITYLGNIYHGRDPRPLLLALSVLRRRGELGTRRVEVAFFGSGRWFHDVSIEQEAERLGLADWVSFHDPVPREETPAIMASSDLLLLLAQDQPLQIPQKLYEYLGARRPILAFADDGGETALMLEAAGGHFVVKGDDPDAVVETLRRALSNKPPVPARFDPVEEWSAAREMARLTAALEGGVRSGAPHVSRTCNNMVSSTDAQTATG